MNQIPPGLFLPGQWFVGGRAAAAARRVLESADGSRLPAFMPADEARRRPELPSAGRIGAVAVAGLADSVNPCALT
ncbi:MAG TPA: hypothetical protein PLQ54_18735, partial [Armatimonadota bacterium]|nr:hypothetical protein [Armatimonadota bacterium]